MIKSVLGGISRGFVHIYKTLLNRFTFFGLLKHILTNFIFILVWITTFKNAYRIDASIRPRIDVNWLEDVDRKMFEISWWGLFIQLSISLVGYSWMYALTRRRSLSVLAALPPFLLNIEYAGSHTLCAALDVFTWLSYGVIHFLSPFVAAFWLWLFAAPGAVSIFAWSFGIQNCLGIITHLSFPSAPPWYGDQYGYPLPAGNYTVPGSAAGLVRVDKVLGTHIYADAFKASPLVFGAFPSLHGAFSCCCFFFMARYSRKGAFILGCYVLWQWFSTMYLRHHWRIDLLGGLAYSALAFSLFYPSLQRADRAYAAGISGGNGWQRLFEGTRLQYIFERKIEGGYRPVVEGNSDSESGRSSNEFVSRDNIREGDESSWMDDLEAAWTGKETELMEIKEAR